MIGKWFVYCLHGLKNIFVKRGVEHGTGFTDVSKYGPVNNTAVMSTSGRDMPYTSSVYALTGGTIVRREVLDSRQCLDLPTMPTACSNTTLSTMKI